VPREPFLRSRAGRVALLAMLSVDIFVIPVLLTLEIIPMRVGDVVFAATMVVAISAMGTGKGRRLVLAVALAAFVIQFFRFVEKNQLLIVADAALSALAMATFAGMVLVDVFRQEPVADRLIDVILAYLLIGTMFAFVYEAVNVLHPGSLTLDGRDVTPAGYVYFSFTTMTSVGFGDALPMRPVSRAIAMAQALTGQLYVAVLIARFVGARHAAARRDGGAS
jgi:Ion channel